MAKYRQAAKVDANQADIVKCLRKIPGVTVKPGHDDILVGYLGHTLWYEIKEPHTVSKKTGEIRESQIKQSQKDLRDTWQGHYRIVHDFQQIAEDLGKLQQLHREINK